MSLLSLPNEILIDIAKHLPSAQHVSSLLRTNRRLSLVLAPHLHNLTIQDPPFEWAINHGRKKLLTSLLNSNIPLPSAGHSSTSLFHRAIKSGHPSTARLLLKHVIASSEPKDDIVYTALEFAVTIGHERFVWQLLDKSGSIYTNGMPGYNLLIRAVMGTSEATVRLLLMSGVNMNPNPYWDIEPPIFSAAYALRGSMIEFLLDCGASIHASGSQGETVLHVVARESQRDPEVGLGLIRLLLSRGALLGRRTFAQETPLAWAMAWGVEVGSPIYAALSGEQGDVLEDFRRYI